ncbi:unnamed protein product [Allacma fusca]|uniref:PNPLA domain-containing protein n=1 Tax=Allacma fusca TaxID=39272 RepID=A0A8J2PAU2_9HEXA|nr:unnamed protein product [Allacma fusca]
MSRSDERVGRPVSQLLLLEDSNQFDPENLELVLKDLESLEASLGTSSSFGLDGERLEFDFCSDIDSNENNRKQGEGEESVKSQNARCRVLDGETTNEYGIKKLEDVTAEQKVWSAIKTVPLVNTGYGLVRTVVYAVKGDKEKVARTIPRAVGGVAELGVYAAVPAAIGLTAASVAASPLIVIAGSAAIILAAGSSVGQLIGGGGELIVDACTQENFSEGSPDVQEQRVYHRIVKDTAIVGAVYSAARAGVYLSKGNTNEAKMSIKLAGFNAVSSTIGVVSGACAAKAVSQTVASSTRNVVSSSTSRWSSVSSVTRSVLQKVGLMAAPKVVTPVEPAILRSLILRILKSPATRNLASSGTHHLVKRMEVCANRVLCSEDFKNLSIDRDWFWKCVQTLKTETNPIRRKIKMEYVLKCLTSCCLKVKDAIQEIQIDDELVAQVVSTGQIVLVQAILVLADPSTSVDMKRAEVLRNITDASVRTAIQYCLELANNYASSKSKSLRTTKLEESLRKYEYIPTSVRAYRPHERNDLPFGKRVLCLDGGGIMGLVELQMLENIEKFVKDINSTESCCIKSCFDYIGGTSTGGLIALILATGHSITEAKGLYFKLKNYVFSGKKPYNGENFDKLLQDFFGVGVKMEDIQDVRIIVTATYGSVDHLKLKLFTNYDETKTEEIWKVARRTCAAPGYFDPMVEDLTSGVECYYDGGLVANNPTRAVLRFIRDEVINGIIVSVGAGMFVDSGCNLPKIRHGLMDRISMFLSGDLEKLIRVFVNQVTKTDGDVVEDAIYSSQLSNAWYFRLTPTLPESIDLDETDSQKIFNMIFHTMAYANDNHKSFRKVAMLLTCRN